MSRQKIVYELEGDEEESRFWSGQGGQAKCIHSSLKPQGRVPTTSKGALVLMGEVAASIWVMGWVWCEFGELDQDIGS